MCLDRYDFMCGLDFIWKKLEKPVCLRVFFSSGTMAVPPAYADLGKSAKDIFSKGFGKTAHHSHYAHNTV